MASTQLAKPHEEASPKAADGAGSQCCEVNKASAVKGNVVNDQTHDAQESKHGQLIKHGHESVLTEIAKVGAAANEKKKKEKEKKEEKKKAASSTKPAAKASHKIKEEKKEKKKNKHKDGSSSGSESDSDGHENKKKPEGKKQVRKETTTRKEN